MVLVLRSERPTARKPHPCSMCGDTIEPGAAYNRVVSVDVGRPWTWKYCTPCIDLFDTMDRLDSGIFDDGVDPLHVLEWCRDRPETPDACAYLIRVRTVGLRTREQLCSTCGGTGHGDVWAGCATCDGDGIVTKEANDAT